MTPDQYLQERLEPQIDWYDSKSLRNQRIFKRLRMVEIVAAALIPLISGAMLSDPRIHLLSAIIIALLGVTIAITAGFLSLGQYQEHWIEYRTTCESLKKEKFLFQTRVEPYNGETAFALLVQRVETLVSKENTNWAQYMMKPEHQDTTKKE